MKKTQTGFKLSMITLLLIGNSYADLPQQVNVSPTPVQISIPTAISPAPEQLGLTETPTRTPTPMGPVMLEAKTEANVRAEPNPDSQRLGAIRAGDLYPVIGRYFRWLEFQYNQSPSGTGWVFDELVTIIGDETAIIDLTRQDAPTADSDSLGQTATFRALTLTPGGLLTATADARIITIPAPANTDQVITGLLQPPPLPGQTVAEPPTPASLLPTFTIPPDLVLVTPTAAFDTDEVSTATPEPSSLPGLPSTDIPPIVPILLLGGLGIIGLLISAIRR
jgi:hypothetical protein